MRGCKAVEAFQRDLEEARYHDDGEDEDAERFETPAADWVFVLVLSGDELGGGPDDCCREEVESCIDERGKHGERGGEGYYCDFAVEKDSVGC